MQLPRARLLRIMSAVFFFFFRVKQKDESDEPAQPIYQNGEVICGKGTTEVTK
jgi:hypothetical protein